MFSNKAIYVQGSSSMLATRFTPQHYKDLPITPIYGSLASQSTFTKRSGLQDDIYDVVHLLDLRYMTGQSKPMYPSE